MAYFDRNTIKALVQDGSLSPYQRDKVIKLEGKAWLDAIEREVGTKAKAATAPTLADLQKKAKALSVAIKDAADAAAAQDILNLMELADDLELPQAGVLELARQYSIIEVTAILRTLSGQKSAGKAFKSAFYGIETKTPDIADVNDTLKQSRKSNRFWR